MLSKYIESKKEIIKELHQRLSKRYSYVSILGKQVDGRSVRVTSTINFSGDTREGQCGFVCKIFQGSLYSEYSFSDITKDNIDEIEQNIISRTSLSNTLMDKHVSYQKIQQEFIKKDFLREMEDKSLLTSEIIDRLTTIKDKIHAYSPLVMQVYCLYTEQNVSAIFIDNYKELTQNYFWADAISYIVVRKGDKVQENYSCYDHNSQKKVLDDLENNLIENTKIAIELLDAELIKPGVYDIITSPAITGLIAHEAFGHGVELDMHVKDRALSKYYLGKEVASPLVTMHDGACSTLSVGSYFFDDDGVLAHDTIIIDKGILKAGISDVLSAMELKLKPTGNGRRESYKRKAYSRMTNTFFEKGNSKLEDMIKSIKHGYMLFQCNNGMEDPKNWNIQCTASYGREIVDGKFSGKIVAPVMMSGNVLDLLMSISMVSDDFVISGGGHCGKGYKEWVCVSDGGPCLKARCKLG